jgi:hypothetical protein
MARAFTDHIITAADLLVRSVDTRRRLSLASIRYNAAISAIELRAHRPAGRPPMLREEIGKGPICVAVVVPGMPKEAHVLSFETATLACPFEAPMSDEGHAVQEVVVLRGCRIEPFEGADITEI